MAGTEESGVAGALPLQGVPLDAGAGDGGQAAGASGGSAGALLRAARVQQGLDLEALASQLRVNVRKLDALENDRHADLPDAAFARALALSVCKVLRADPAPVLALLPRAAQTEGLEHVTRGLAQPFEQPGLLSRVKGVPAAAAAQAFSPLSIIVLGLLLGALALAFFWPPKDEAGGLHADGPHADGPAHAASQGPEAGGTVPVFVPAPEYPVGEASAAASGAMAASAVPAASAAIAMSAASAASVSGGAPAALMPAAVSPAAAAVASAPGPAMASASASTAGGAVRAGAAVVNPSAAPVAALAPASASASGAASAAELAAATLVIRAQADTWVEVRNADGRLLVSRLMRQGDVLPLNGKLPVRVLAGNAGATELQFRGRRVDLLPYTRDNVARLELK